MPSRLFHITTRDEWQVAQAAGEYRPAAFVREQFIHCSYDRQVCSVANRFFAARGDLVLLEIELRRLPCPVVDENLEGGRELYPHIYGPLPAAAVVAVHPFAHGQGDPFKLPTLVASDEKFLSATAYLVELLLRVAGAAEAVAPDTQLSPHVGECSWCDGDEDSEGYWCQSLGFGIVYRGAELGKFMQGSYGTCAERVRNVGVELLSQIQDVIALETREPWPFVTDGRRDRALPDAALEGSELHMWYGERASPALLVPTVSLA